MENFNCPAVQQQHGFEKQVERVDINALFDLLSQPQLQELMEEHLSDYRERGYPPMVTLAMFLRQVMSADGSCQNAVNEANVSRQFNELVPNSANTSGYCQARKRLPLEWVKSLVLEMGERLNDQTPKPWLWQGRPIKLVDGTTVTLPDTAANQARYPQPGHQEPGVGFPLARLVTVISLSSGGLCHAAMGPYQGKGTGEHGLFRDIIKVFEPGDLMLADSYYCSYFLIAQMLNKGVDVLFEQHGARKSDFRRGEKLGSRDHRVYWEKPARPSWMSQQEYECFPARIQVREMKVRKKILVTTLSREKAHSKNALGKLFFERWHVELDLRNIKTTLGMERLSCKTAEMCEKEMWVYFLAYNLIRLLMCEASVRVGVLPRALSFKHTLQLWVYWWQCQSVVGNGEELEPLLLLIGQKRVGNRPGRIEPRAVKRRPKPYPRLKKPRQEERERVKKHGHDKKLRA